MRVMKVMRPGTRFGSSRSASAIASVPAVFGPSLTPSGLRHPAQQLHVGAVELAGALADPDHVAGRVVGPVAAGVDAGQRVLVVEQQRLVGGVEVDDRKVSSFTPQATMKPSARSISPASSS